MKSHKLTFLLCLLLSGACGSAPHDVTKSVPLGSNLSDLDRYLVRGAGSDGEVTEWVPVMRLLAGPQHITNEFGTFQKRFLGKYDFWKASSFERNSFTGVIDFFHHGSTSSDMNSFIYVKGKLRKKEWGYLPG